MCIMNSYVRTGTYIDICSVHALCCMYTHLILLVVTTNMMHSDVNGYSRDTDEGGRFLRTSGHLINGLALLGAVHIMTPTLLFPCSEGVFLVMDLRISGNRVEGEHGTVPLSAPHVTRQVDELHTERDVFNYCLLHAPYVTRGLCWELHISLSCRLHKHTVNAHKFQLQLCKCPGLNFALAACC